jgi:thioredoxin 1
MRLTLIAAALLIANLSAVAQAGFPSLEAWKSAVINGDQAALSRLYSPRAITEAAKTRLVLQDELAFWASLRAKGMTEFNPRLLEVSKANDRARLVLRITMASGTSHLYSGMQQEWVRDSGGWKIVASRRSAAFEPEPTRILPQPAAPNVSLYADPREAESDLNIALARAAKEHKRVLVVFGGNWCYDCHVLDATFHSRDFAPLVDANFVVVHINIGDEGKDNNNLAARLGVALDKGVPSLGVLEPDGKVIYAQKNGEFEATEKIGPADVRAFLEKWKPRPRG